MKTQISIHPPEPNKIYSVHPDGYEAIIEVVSATDFSLSEEIQWKKAAQNYSATEAAGHYFLLSLSEISGDQAITDEDLAKIAINMLLEAAEYWNRYFIALLN